MPRSKASKAKRNGGRKNDAVSLLLSMPVEVIDLIIPDPAKHHIFRPNSTDLCAPGSQGMCQVPIKRKANILRPKYEDFAAFTEERRKKAQVEHEPVRALLFALSHTCRTLREYTLPLLWRVLHVNTVEELGSLRDLFRLSPVLPTHVKHFSFTWDMGGELVNEDYDREIQAYPGETLLGLAFTDRTKRMKRPGRHYARGAGNGPDGVGPDERIADAFELNEALVHVISSFTTLRAFSWDTHMLPVPQGAMAHLENLETLTTLWVSCYLGPAHHHQLPLYNDFYRCAKHLDRLELEILHDRSDIPNELFEADIWAAPEHPYPTYSQLTNPARGRELEAAKAAFEKTLRLNNTRTIINAARGGQLRVLFYIGPNDAFAIRALLPAWVGVEQWDGPNARDWGPWLRTAASLRTCVVHYVRWYADTPHKRLTTEDIQDLPGKLRAEVKAKRQGASPEFERFYGRLPPNQHPLERYFDWLEKDETVASEVAKAWNEVVARGEASKVICYCTMCKPSSEKSEK